MKIKCSIAKSFKLQVQLGFPMLIGNTLQKTTKTYHFLSNCQKLQAYTKNLAFSLHTSLFPPRLSNHFHPTYLTNQRQDHTQTNSTNHQREPQTHGQLLLSLLVACSLSLKC